MQTCRLLEDAARLVASCANRFLSVVALGAQGPAGADDYKTISQVGAGWRVLFGCQFDLHGARDQELFLPWGQARAGPVSTQLCAR